MAGMPIWSEEAFKENEYAEQQYFRGAEQAFLICSLQSLRVN